MVFHLSHKILLLNVHNGYNKENSGHILQLLLYYFLLRQNFCHYRRDRNGKIQFIFPTISSVVNTRIDWKIFFQYSLESGVFSLPHLQKKVFHCYVAKVPKCAKCVLTIREWAVLFHAVFLVFVKRFPVSV